MSGTTSTILLWLFAINLGIAFGAGVYEHRIVVSRWISSSGEAGAHWNAAAARLALGNSPGSHANRDGGADAHRDRRHGHHSRG